MNIGILLTTGPEYQNSQSVATFATALLSAENKLSLFLMDDGMKNVLIIVSDSSFKRFAKPVS